MVRDRALFIEGELEQYDRADFVIRDNDEGAWTVEGIPASEPLLAYLGDDVSLYQDAGIILQRDGVTVMSGPIKSIDFSDGPDGQVVTIGGIDDTGVLADRIILPTFDGPPYTAAYDTIGPVSAEEAMRHFVFRHASTGTTTARWVPGLTLGPFSGLGVTGTWSHRFTNLLTALQEIALAGDGLRFSVEQQEDNVRYFMTRGRSDLRDRIRLSVAGGLLGSVVSSEQAPGANYVYVLGKGELESRTVVEGGDAESIARYGRVEVAVDQRQTDDAVELAGALASTLEEGREDLALAVEPLDDEDAQLWVDYFPGDRVTALTADGRLIECYVVEATIALTGTEGAVVTPVLATTRVAPSSKDRVRSLGQRLGHLERTNENGFSIGMVIPWMRPVGDIPAGFELADGTGGIPDLTDRYWFGAGGAFTVGETAGLPLVSKDVVANFQHSHGPGTLAFPHTHSHSHGPNNLAFPHTHSHSHSPGTLAFPHTHSHSHGGGILAWPHDHSLSAHTHGPGDLTLNHKHDTNIDHNHGAVDSGYTDVDSVAVGHASLGSGATDHKHSVDLPSLGTSNVRSGTPVEVSAGGDTDGPDQSHTGTSENGSAWTGVTATDAAAQTPGAPTGLTGGDATAQTPEAATGTTSTDATAAAPGTANGTTGNSLSATQSLLMPLVGVLPIYRTV